MAEKGIMRLVLISKLHNNISYVAAGQHELFLFKTFEKTDPMIHHLLPLHLAKCDRSCSNDLTGIGFSGLVSLVLPLWADR